MLSTELIVRQFAEGVIAGITSHLKTKSVIESFFWRYDGKKLQIGSKLAWITVLEDGRPPGKWPPRDAIKSWIQAVGISSSLPIDSLAFLIQRSIGENGTVLWQLGGGSGILSQYVNQEHIKKNLTEKLVNQVVSEIKLTIFKSN